LIALVVLLCLEFAVSRRARDRNLDRSTPPHVRHRRGAENVAPEQTVPPLAFAADTDVDSVDADSDAKVARPGMKRGRHAPSVIPQRRQRPGATVNNDDESASAPSPPEEGRRKRFGGDHVLPMNRPQRADDVLESPPGAGGPIRGRGARERLSRKPRPPMPDDLTAPQHQRHDGQDQQTPTDSLKAQL